MLELANRLKTVKVSASAAMTDKARELRYAGVKIVSLSSGEPIFRRRRMRSMLRIARRWRATPSIPRSPGPSR
jgi:hypothetical protein